MSDLICPTCKKKVKYFLAYSKSMIRVYSYDGKKFKMIEKKTDFTDMNFVCPKCDTIVSKNKDGLDFYLHKKYIRDKHSNVKPVKQIKY